MLKKIKESMSFLYRSIIEQRNMAPNYITKCILHAFIFESAALIAIYLPSIMLRIATGSYDIKLSVLIIIAAISIISILNFVQSILHSRISNEREKLFNKRVAEFNKKLFNIGLASAESNEYLDKEEEALTGLYETKDILFEIFSVLLGRIITIIVSFSVFSQVHFSLGVFVLITIIIDCFIDSKISKLEVSHSKDIAQFQYKRNYIAECMHNTEFGIEERLFNMKQFLLFKFENLAQEIRNVEKKHSFRLYKYKLWLVALVTLQFLGIYLFAIWRFKNGLLRIDEFLMFTTAAATMTAAVKQFINTYTVVSTMASYYKSTEEYMQEPDYGTNDGHMTLPKQIDELKFENVTFTYPNQTTPAIENLSFSLKHNDIVAIVGDNGAGKSTIIKLILRLYKIDSGKILLNGINIYEYDWNEYCTFFSSAFQDYNMYAMSIRENLEFGNQCENIDRYLNYVTLSEKIKSLSAGLDTQYTQDFSDEGVLFSGGEEQRLIIARALCKDNANALTMDEPTASLDPLAESNLNYLIYGIRKNKFTVFVSHRFSTTRFCTKILVMEGGKLVECGGHEELIEANGIYAAMYKMQLAYYT